MHSKLRTSNILALCTAAALCAASAPALAWSNAPTNWRITNGDPSAVTDYFTSIWNYTANPVDLIIPLVVDTAGGKTATLVGTGTHSIYRIVGAARDTSATYVSAQGSFPSASALKMIWLSGATVPSGGYMYATAHITTNEALYSIDYND
jgi:hypothetical protein